MRATGLEKGGLYHHFESRDAIALAGFQFSTEELGARIRRSLEGKTSAKAKMLALLHFPLDGYWRGGCPIANLAVEADDGDRALAREAREAMGWLLAFFVCVIEEGAKSGEFAKGGAEARAIHLVAALEGGILLSNLYKDLGYLKTVVKVLELEVEAGLPTKRP